MGLGSGSLYSTSLFLALGLLAAACGEARSAQLEVHATPARILAHPDASVARAEASEAQAAALAPVDALNADGIAWLVESAVARGELPGCVVAVGTRMGVSYLRAFGERTPGEPMTLDTRFDLASVTKPVATATAIMSLAEAGLVDIDAPVSRYLPEFRLEGKQRISVRELLLHTGGLPKVSPLADFEAGRGHALRTIARGRLDHAPGAQFSYSDLGFVVLGELVARVSGTGLDRYAQSHLFAPLGMADTMFLPPLDQAQRSAPTEERDGKVIRGVVDDPRAYRMGGVAGHAGLFSTASDLARYAQMLLRGGELDGVRVLREDTVERFLVPRRAADATRALGWDVMSGYALGRGRTMSAGSVGHGGYTGTSLWLDPEADMFVILLSNRVHAGGKGTIHPLTSSVADVALRARKGFERNELRTGIDVLEEESFARLRGRSIAILSHGAARDRAGVRTLDRLLAAPELHVRAILAPEHGFDANREGHIESSSLGNTPLYSLFGKTRRPDDKMLRGVDTIVIDLVDVGARFYTYMSTVVATLEVAAELNIQVMLLDRPNPIDGTHVEGPVSEPAFASFVNYHPLPLRHGMTAGELALWLARERGIAVNLHVVRVEHWQREAWVGDTDLTWHAPSPNLRTKEQAMLYPAVALVEGTNVSVGRGTDHAFAVVGAPFIDGQALAAELTRAGVAGVSVSATRFRPKVGPYAGQRLAGVALLLDDPHQFSASRTGLSLIRALSSLYREQWDTSRLEKLVAHRRTVDMLLGNTPLPEVELAYRRELDAFEASRKTTLLY